MPHWELSVRSFGCKLRASHVYQTYESIKVGGWVGGWVVCSCVFRLYRYRIDCLILFASHYCTILQQGALMEVSVVKHSL